MGTLDGYSVLVTGGGSGIGDACARALVDDGAAVTICGRTAETLVAAADALRVAADAAGTAPVAWISADVTSEPQVEAAVAHVRSRTAAGASTASSRRPADRATWARSCSPTSRRCGPRSTSTSSARSSRSSTAPRRWRRRAEDRSSASLRTRDATRSGSWVRTARRRPGLDHLVRVAADELGRAGVRVNSVLPGVVATELMTAITGGGPVLDSYLEEIPLAPRRSTGRDRRVRPLPHRARVGAGSRGRTCRSTAASRCARAPTTARSPRPPTVPILFGVS